MLVIVCRDDSYRHLGYGKMPVATPTRRKLGKKIRSFRKKMGISQEELGFRSNLHRTYIGSIERGEQNISVDNIHKIAKALKVSPRDLLD